MSECGDIFDQGTKLLTGIVYRRIKRYPTFIHLKSFFNDYWYNFLVPVVSEADFSWSEAEKLIKLEAKDGFKVSYYVNSLFLSEYSVVFDKKGLGEIGSDVYMVGKFNKLFEDIRCDYEKVTDDNIDLFVKMAVECFPDWDNGEEYSRYFQKLSKTSPNLVIESYISKLGRDSIGFGGIVLSKKIGLAYLHNTGVLEKFRRQGYYLDLVRYRCNRSIEEKVNRIFALVEEGSGSYYGLQKLGFKPQLKYYLFGDV